ncbi:MAG: HAD family hydrolase [Treponemataceae bacterium]
MKIYSIPSVLKILVFDIDSTLYTNAVYAHEQIDVQIRHFADLRGISHQEARKLISEFRKAHAQQEGVLQISLGNALTHFGIPISQSILWRENLIDPKDFLQRDKKLHETLSSLAKKYQFIAVTNNPEKTAFKTLETLGVETFFPHIIGLDTCGVSKPHKEPYELAIKLMGTKAEHCISIGDRYDIDLAIPIELGMGAILVDDVEDVYGLLDIL